MRTPKDIAITFGNGQRVKAERVGDVLLYLGEVEIKLCDVLYIPYAAANLFSIRSATKHGASFSFDGNGCTIEYNGTRVGAATLGVDGTYKLYNQHGTVQATALAALVDDQAQLWHRRFAHLGYDNMTKLVEENMVNGINVSPEAFKEQKTIICEPCIMAKHPKSPFPTSDKAADGEAAEPEVNQLLQLVHMDVFGPMPEPSLGGSKYGATFLDDHSKLSIVRPITFKSEVPKTVREVIQLLETQSGQQCRAIRTDNGSEYLNAELSDYLKSKGIIHQTTVPYNPEQNGAAERLNRTLMDRARAMIKDAALQAELWAEAVTTASYIRNLSPVAGKLKTPWELFFGYKPDASPLRVFGATAYAHVPKEKRHKLEDRSKRGIMIGYGDNKKGYRILLEDNTIITSRDVIFDEHTEAKQVQVQEDSERVGADGVQDHDDSDSNGVEEHDTPLATSSEGDPITPPNAASDEEDAPAAPDTTRYPTRERRHPSNWWETHGTAMAAFAEPTTYEEAMASDNAEQWRQAMDDEMTSLLANQTWVLEELPGGASAIPVKWVYKIKTAANGSVERYKARLVAKGFKQREGIDFEEVFAPVSKYATLRTLLAMAAAEDLELHQLDIKTAFLNGDIEEDIYLQQPPGYEEGPGNLACHLRRALYGLRQAPRQWHARLKPELELCGFTESEADPGLFVHHSKESTVYLLVYVDDILIVAKDLPAVAWAKEKIMTTFEARDLGEAKLYLGMTIERDRRTRTIKLGQERMTTQLVSKYGLENARSKSVPLATSIKLNKDEGEPLDTNKYAYNQLIGSLMYLAVCTRPDVAHAVGALAKYLATPTTVHWSVATDVLRYLAGTKDYGITFGGGHSIMPEPMGYCDADFAGDVDTRRSTTGYIFLLNGGAISWSSRRQQTVAASTTEAEYMAAAAATKEALWLRKLLFDLRKSGNTITIKADNQGAIKLLKNPITSMRSKHIDVIYHFARERVKRKEVCFEYVKTEHMIADILTKAIPAAKHVFCRGGMGVTGSTPT